MYKRLHSTIEFLEGTLALFILIALIAAATFAAMSAIPNGLEVESSDTTVAAGDEEISTSIPESLIITATYEQYRHDFEYFASEDGKTHTFEITPRTLEEGTLIVDLVDFENLGDESYEISVESIIEGEIGDSLDLYLLSEEQKLPIFVPDLVNSTRFNLAPNTSREASLVYELKERINFPVSINIQMRVR